MAATPNLFLLSVQNEVNVSATIRAENLYQMCLR